MSRLPRARSTMLLREDGSRRCQLEIPGLGLRVLSGPDAGVEVSLPHPRLEIGSASGNDLVLGDPAVSRRHAALLRDGEALVLRDLGSTNGTYVGEIEIREAPIESGTRFRVGDSEIEVRATTLERAARVTARQRFGDLVGGSRVMQDLYALIRAAAPTEATLLLTGESGTGKEMVARALHAASGREGPLVIFDAGVSDPEMVRSDLFGHVKGAFTGALDDRKGAFREAAGGTLFLDEIGELPLELQPRLLRVLETREVAPIGSDRHRRVDTRVLAATHRDLAALVAAGRFREDLYYRLSVLPIEVPPLRERREDLPLLIAALEERLGLGVDLGEEALAALGAYHWPGNVRELRNLLERLAITARGRRVSPADLKLTPTPGCRPAPPSGSPSPSPVPDPEILDLGILERRAIEAALERFDGNQRQAAAALNISLATLKRRLKSYRETD